MTEFTINFSISKMTGYAPFELNYGVMPQIMNEVCLNKQTNKGVRDFANQALRNIASAHDAIIEARTFQTFYANQKRRTDPLIAKGNLVYPSTENLNLPNQ